MRPIHEDLAEMLHLARSDLAGGETTPYLAAETRHRLGRALLALADRLPTCAHCDQRPAACFGYYEGGEGGPAPACDECCGHGNEDGWCVPIAELPTWAAKQRARLAEVQAEVEQLRAKAAKLEAERDAELARNAALYEQLGEERAAVAEADGVITELRGQLDRRRADDVANAQSASPAALRYITDRQLEALISHYGSEEHRRATGGGWRTRAALLELQSLRAA